LASFWGRNSFRNRLRTFKLSAAGRIIDICLLQRESGNCHLGHCPLQIESVGEYSCRTFREHLFSGYVCLPGLGYWSRAQRSFLPPLSPCGVSSDDVLFCVLLFGIAIAAMALLTATVRLRLPSGRAATTKAHMWGKLNAHMRRGEKKKGIGLSGFCIHRMLHSSRQATFLGVSNNGICPQSRAGDFDKHCL